MKCLHFLMLMCSTANGATYYMHPDGKVSTVPPTQPKPMAATVCNCGGTKVMCSCEDCKCSIRKPTVTESKSSNLSYSEFYALAVAGKCSTFTVGIDLPGVPRCDEAKGLIVQPRNPSLEYAWKIEDGQYSCWSDGIGVGIKPTGPSVPNVATPRYDPTTRYYQPAWNVQSCPGGNCNRR